MWRRWPSGETRHCQIKTAPEKMHRTALPAETRAELLEYTIALHEHAPEPVGIFAIIRAVLLILIKRDRIFDLVRQAVDLHGQLEFLERIHPLAIKSRDRLGTQFQDAERAIAFQDPELVFDEVETHFERIVAVWDR